MSQPPAHPRRRFWVETVLAALTGGLFALTLVWHEWLEALGFDPDNGDGSAEWAIVAVLFAVFVVFAVAARLEWRRTAAAPDAG
jgi:hypothetical protein